MNKSYKKAGKPLSKRNALFEALLKTSLGTKGQRILRRDKNGPSCLSFAQQRLWFLDQIEPGNPAYNVVRAYRLSGKPDVDILRKSFDEIWRRHDSLRTIFTSVDGDASQVVIPSGFSNNADQSIPFELVDLKNLTADDRDRQSKEILYKEGRRPFELSKDIPIRVSLISLSEKEHILLLVMHHIISDGWSLGVLFRELSVLYEAFISKKPSPLTELPIQYADFAVWHREWVQGGSLKSQFAYWEEHLSDYPRILNMPTDRPRPKLQTYQGARYFLQIDKSLTDRLRTFCDVQGVTLFMVLLAAFNTLLYRYTGQEDIIVGSPIANRTQPEVVDIIGFFVNTLALQTDLSGDPTFLELLGRVRETALNAFVNQDVPFDRLVEKLKVERDLSYPPLFQVTLVLQNMPPPATEFSGLTLHPIEMDNGTAKYDFTLFFVPNPEGLNVTIEYNTDLFYADSAMCILKNVRKVLEEVLNNPEQPISEIPILDKGEADKILVTWNDTKVDFSDVRPIHKLFEAQVERLDNAAAVIFEKEQLSYRELNTRANQLAHHLEKYGVGPNVLVGLCLERSLEMVVGLMAILKVGGAYVPFDPEYPKARLSYMFADAKFPMLLTQERILERLPVYKGSRVCLDTGWQTIAQESEFNPSNKVAINDLAYVIYTSGSTGNPKGVMISHDAIVNHMHWMQSVFPLTHEDRVLQKTPFSFDASIWEFFAPLLMGATLIMARPGGHQDAGYLTNLIRREHVTVLQVVPSLLRMLLEEKKFKACQTLRRIFCGGEVLSPELQERLFATLDVGLYNLYGPTETTIDASFWTCSQQDNRRAVPIGRPIANTHIYILDSQLQPVPIGVIGELFVGGKCLSSGYLNKSDLTAKKFIPNPFCNKLGSKLYRTGDLGRYLHDGAIEFLGRCDDQVKIRGFRIEPAEIEGALANHPGVKQAVVVARENEFGDKSLLAYIVSNNEGHKHTRDLRKFLKEKLPDYMIPSAFVFLDIFPLLPNGKVDRRSLPQPEQEAFEREDRIVPPRTPIEESLAAIWSEILDLKDVSVHDNFFELGGQSLLAMRVVAWIRKRLNVDLSVHHIFEAPTIAELAVIVIEKQMGQLDTRELGELVKDLEKIS